MSELHYADERAFRTGRGPNLEARVYHHSPDSVVVSLDDYDAPELSLRLDRDTARALGEWLIARTSHDR